MSLWWWIYYDDYVIMNNRPIESATLSVCANCLITLLLSWTVSSSCRPIVANQKILIENTYSKCVLKSTWLISLDGWISTQRMLECTCYFV